MFKKTNYLDSNEVLNILKIKYKKIISKIENFDLQVEIVDKKKTLELSFSSTPILTISRNTNLNSKQIKYLINALKLRKLNLESKRLIIKPIDFDVIDEYLIFSTDFDTQDKAGDKVITEISDAKLEIEESKKYGYSYSIINKIENKFIGCVIFYPKSIGFEIGYSISKDYRRKGYTFEACNTLIKYAFSNTNIKVIYARHFPNNDASMNLLYKLGFKYQNYVENSFFHRGKEKYMPTYNYFLTKKRYFLNNCYRYINGYFAKKDSK
ncbi:MAG: GNAT family N-acetyltransferase [Acholeplasmatales bacterium]|jgi:RimJ/RimL family protein N-acetyltransferase|nr:GNAT family N-acetyltransferase [Acholeplasmatales bacterium]